MATPLEYPLLPSKRKDHHRANPPEAHVRDQEEENLINGIGINSQSWTGKRYATPGIFKNIIPESRHESQNPGNEGEDGANLSYNGSPADSEESDQDDAALQQERSYAQVRKATLENVSTVEYVPPDIALLSQDICRVFRRVWTEGLSDATEAEIKETNKKIRRLNKEEGRKEETFLIPGDRILRHIELCRDHMIRWHMLRDKGRLKRDECQNEGRAVAALWINIMPDLAKCGLSYKLITTKAVTELLDNMRANTDLKRAIRDKLTRLLEQDFALPSLYQTSIAFSAKSRIVDVFHHAERGELREANNLVPHIEQVNERIGQDNESLGFKSDDHLLPTSYLSELLQEDRLKDEETREQQTQALKAQYAAALFSLGFNTLAKCLVGLDKIRRQTLPANVQNDIHHQIEEFRQPWSAAETTSVEDILNPDGLITKKPLRADFNGHRPESPSSIPDLDEITPGVPGPRIEGNGKTQWGQIIAVQSFAFFYRIIFNRGSEKYPVYDMRPGSCLPKNAVKRFAEKFKLEKQQSRDYEDIRLITDIVELVGGSLTRFRVLWRKKPFVTFPTRTELSDIVGKAMVDGPDGIREQLKAKRQTLAKWHEACRTKEWHPDHRPPKTITISKEGKASLPWIFGPQDSDEQGADFEAQQKVQDTYEDDVVEDRRGKKRKVRTRGKDPADPGNELRSGSAMDVE